MRNKASKHSAHWALILIWLGLTLMLLLLILQLLWRHYYLEQQKNTQLKINQIELKFNDLIDSFLYSVFPFYGRELNLNLLEEARIKNCKENLLPLLKTLQLKNPALLGAQIRDSKDTIICSTLENNYQIPYPLKHEPFLYGPIILSPGKQAAYILQLPLGQYYLDNYILEKTFTDLLNSLVGKKQLITLFNRDKKLNVLVVGDRSILPTFQNKTAISLVKLSIKNLSNYEVRVFTELSKPDLNFFYRELPYLLGIVLLSLILYFRTRSLLDHRFSLHYALIYALKNDHFQPAFQIIRDNTTNKYCGSEVLLRWQTDNKELIMPDAFIHEAEETGLIVPITLQLVEKTFKQMQDFLKNNRDFYLAFNLSAIHFTDEKFFEEFYELCTKYDIPFKQLMLEITERQILDQSNPQFIDKMNSLRQKGFNLAVDDFGTGHASVKYLQHFPFNYLKIDKIFIQAIGTDAITETLNYAIIHMASCLKLNIIAEGVETAEQLQYLIENNVNYAQGWYFARAVSYEHLMQIISEDLK